MIPAHNEAQSLAGVIREVRQAVSADIVVIDDGSTDATPEIALAEGAQLLKLPFNLGIGAAVQTGFKLAAREGNEIAVQVDGDGQHKATLIPELIKPIAAGDADMVVGSRYLTPKDYCGSLGRRAGTALFSRILSLMLKQKLTDATSGFRAVGRELIELFANDYPRDYPEVEALLLAHLARRRVKEVPVTMRQRGGGCSSINSFRSAYYMVKVLLALIATFSRQQAPRIK
jgi:glycosyltransferase involved in cell wall biosynthesis